MCVCASVYVYLCVYVCVFVRMSVYVCDYFFGCSLNLLKYVER